MPVGKGKNTKRKRDTGRKRHAPIRAKTIQERTPSSECIRYASWNPVEPEAIARIKKGGRVLLSDFGEVRIIFARAFPRYNYLLRAYFSYRDFRAWMNAKSVGRYWNFRLKGNV